MPKLFPERVGTHPWTNQRNLGCVEEIGKGAFGIVYKVFDENEQRHFAVKEIEIKLKTNIDELKKEVETLRELTSEFVVRYFNSWPEGPQTPEYSASIKSYLCIKMELCNSNLDKWLKERETQDQRNDSLDQINEIFIQIAKGLEYIHNAHVLHRDLKPDNVLLMGQSAEPNSLKVKLGDFGLAKSIRNTKENLSQKGAKPYRSPEMFDQRPYTAKTDIFSAGLIFYETLHVFTSVHPRVDAFEKLKMKHYKFPAEFLETFKKEGRIVQLMTKYEPEMRPTASELVILLNTPDNVDEVISLMSNNINEAGESETDQLNDRYALLTARDNDNENISSVSSQRGKSGFRKWMLRVIALLILGGILSIIIFFIVIAFINVPEWPSDHSTNDCKKINASDHYVDILMCLAMGDKIEGNLKEAWDGIKTSFHQSICKLDNCPHSDFDSREVKTSEDPSQVICKKDMMKRWEIIPPRVQAEVHFRIPSSSKCVGVIGIDMDDTGTGGECTIQAVLAKDTNGVDVTVTSKGETFRGLHFIVLVIGHGECYQVN